MMEEITLEIMEEITLEIMSITTNVMESETNTNTNMATAQSSPKVPVLTQPKHFSGHQLVTILLRNSRTLSGTLFSFSSGSHAVKICSIRCLSRPPYMEESKALKREQGWLLYLWWT